MKTLGEIVEGVRNGEKPDYDDLRYAICALDALATFHRKALFERAQSIRLWNAIEAKNDKQESSES